MKTQKENLNKPNGNDEEWMRLPKPKEPRIMYPNPEHRLTVTT